MKNFTSILGQKKYNMQPHGRVFHGNSMKPSLLMLFLNQWRKFRNAIDLLLESHSALHRILSDRFEFLRGRSWKYFVLILGFKIIRLETIPEKIEVFQRL
jgi:hypothetical protein